MQHNPDTVQAVLLVATVLQLLAGELLSRLLARETSPFLACLVGFCLAHVAARILAPTALSSMSATGQYHQAQKWTVAALALFAAMLLAAALPAHWLDVDVPAGAHALVDTGAFWRGAWRTVTDFVAALCQGRLPTIPQPPGVAAGADLQMHTAGSEQESCEAGAAAYHSQVLHPARWHC